jgi:hypothetical protein
MNRKSVFIAALVVLIIAGLLYFYGGSQAPSGQAPLQNLTSQNVGEIRNAFNAAKDRVRLLILVSPT